MGIVESGAGAYIGAKVITNKNQRTIVENLKDYYNNPKDIKECKRGITLGLCAVLLPFIFLWVVYQVTQHVDSSNIKHSGLILGLVIGVFFLLLIIGTRIAQHMTEKYTHQLKLQNTETEKKYRWSYCIVFTDEISEYEDYIKKHPLSRLTGLVETIYLDRTTLNIIGKK